MKIWLGVVTILLIGMAGFVAYEKLTSMESGQVAATTQEIKYVDQCGTECQKYIDTKFMALENRLLALLPTNKPTIAPAPKTVVNKKTRLVTYVSVPNGGGSTTSMEWVDVPGTDFYLNKADYPGLAEAYFEVNMKLNGGGRAFVRLFDVTNGIGVQGSDAQTASYSDTLVESGKMNFWNGKNLYRVQIRSLTTETAYYNSGRLRLITVD